MDVPEVFRTNVEWLLMRAGQKARDVVELLLKPYDVGIREMTVIKLVDGNQYNQQVIANVLGLNKNTLVSVIDSLETKGLAERRKNPGNRREQIIELTQKGKKLLAAWAKHTGPERYWVSQILQKHECLVLENLLRRLLEAERNKKFEL